MLKPKVVIAACALAAVAAAGLYLHARAPEPQSDARPQTVQAVTRRDFVRGIRLSGTVEAVEATTDPDASARRSEQQLAGHHDARTCRHSRPPGRSAGRVRPAGTDTQRARQAGGAERPRAADPEAAAQEDAAKAADDSTLKQAESAQQRAQLEMLKNEMLPKIEAEKNMLALEEAQAKLKQLQQTYDLKRQAAAADIKVLEIRRDRAQNSDAGRRHRTPSAC